MSLMKTYGAPCGTDADCQKLLGADGKCLKDILGVYSPPGRLLQHLLPAPRPADHLHHRRAGLH
jgi:hypothetical protein